MFIAGLFYLAENLLNGKQAIFCGNSRIHYAGATQSIVAEKACSRGRRNKKVEGEQIYV